MAKARKKKGACKKWKKNQRKRGGHEREICNSSAYQTSRNKTESEFNRCFLMLLLLLLLLLSILFFYLSPILIFFGSLSFGFIIQDAGNFEGLFGFLMICTGNLVDPVCECYSFVCCVFDWNSWNSNSINCTYNWGLIILI